MLEVKGDRERNESTCMYEKPLLCFFYTFLAQSQVIVPVMWLPGTTHNNRYKGKAPNLLACLINQYLFCFGAFYRERYIYWTPESDR